MNEEYAEKLDYLISLKKEKKDPNKMERTEFQNAWEKLSQEEGFSERVEAYLYSGLVYCGAKPFRSYMKSSADSAEALKELYKGKLYGENCGITSSILIHLLALSINEGDIPSTISLIQNIPSAMVNKEGKQYGQADRSLKKYFLDELRTDVELPAFQSLMSQGLTAKEQGRFMDAMKFMINKMDFGSYSVKCKTNIYRINKWMNAVEPIQTVAPPEKSHDSEIKTIKTPILSEELGGSMNSQENLQTESESQPEQSEDTLQGKKSESDSQSELDKAKHQIELFKSDNAHMEEELSLCHERIKNYETRLTKCCEDIENTERKIAELLRQITMLEKQVSSARDQNTKDKNEIAQRDEMIEMIRRDRLRGSDEVIRRLASKLRPYYEDYQDAKGLKMSVELGENMRDQLGEVFDILVSAGVSLK